jgi:hypothetical protein
LKYPKNGQKNPEKPGKRAKTGGNLMKIRLMQIANKTAKDVC